MDHETLRQWIKTAEKAERPEAVAASAKDAEIAALREQVREPEMNVTSAPGGQAPSPPQGGGRRRHGDREALAAIV